MRSRSPALLGVAVLAVSIACESQADRQADDVLGPAETIALGVDLSRTIDRALVGGTGPVSISILKLDPARVRLTSALSNDEVLKAETVEGMARATGNPRFAWDAYRRFLGMYTSVVHGVSREPIEALLRALKTRLGVRLDTEVPTEGLQELCAGIADLFRRQTGRPFPQDPKTQLWGAIEAVFRSWNADKAVT